MDYFFFAVGNQIKGILFEIVIVKTNHCEYMGSEHHCAPFSQRAARWMRPGWNRGWKTSITFPFGTVSISMSKINSL